jgi:hypothetical protein
VKAEGREKIKNSSAIRRKYLRAIKSCAVEAEKAFEVALALIILAQAEELISSDLFPLGNANLAAFLPFTFHVRVKTSSEKAIRSWSCCFVNVNSEISPLKSFSRVHTADSVWRRRGPIAAP